MGWLEQVATGKREYLAERTLIGRGPACWVRVPDRSVSNEHAVLAFVEQGWSLKDLGSRNGSWVDGRKLTAGHAVLVWPGARLQFGDIEMRITNVEPPTLCVRSEQAGTCQCARRGMLGLPNEENPVASLYEAEPGSWMLEHDGRVQALRDGDTFYVGDERYQAAVPSGNATKAFQSTMREHQELFLSEFSLHLEVSQDQEAVVTRLVAGAHSIKLAARTIHQVLLLLAEQRLADRKAGIEEAECGWIYSDELAKMLGYDRERMNVDIHRLRQQVCRAGIVDGGRLIERRPTTHQLRLAMAGVEISGSATLVATAD